MYVLTENSLEKIILNIQEVRLRVYVCVVWKGELSFFISDYATNRLDSTGALSTLHLYQSGSVVTGALAVVMLSSYHSESYLRPWSNMPSILIYKNCNLPFGFQFSIDRDNTEDKVVNKPGVKKWELGTRTY